jgi:acetolactate synthase II small subunit
MSVHFEIRLKPAEGALLRTLGLIQRRGFAITELALREAGEGQLLRLAVNGNGRCPAVLARQVERLHDVASIERVEHEPWQATVADCARALASLVPSGDLQRLATSEARG